MYNVLTVFRGLKPYLNRAEVITMKNLLLTEKKFQHLQKFVASSSM